MKKFYLALFSLLFPLFFTSCVKEYTCQCTISFSGKPGLPEPYTKEYNLTNKRKKADQECKNFSQTYTEDGITTKEDCVLY